MIGHDGDRVTNSRDRAWKFKSRYFNRLPLVEIAEPTGISVKLYTARRQRVLDKKCFLLRDTLSDWLGKIAPLLCLQSSLLTLYFRCDNESDI
jgi:hypothetical protein